MSAKRKITPKIASLLDKALEAIIDQWYLSVSDYYITCEKKADNPEIKLPEELKRFHDETGHRIKFNKGDLDFTYGLSIVTNGESYDIEASVNNKVPGFNYAELVRRLTVYYQAAKDKPIEGFKKLKKVRNGETFLLPDDLHNSITVEQKKGKRILCACPLGLVRIIWRILSQTRRILWK